MVVKFVLKSADLPILAFDELFITLFVKTF